MAKGKQQRIKKAFKPTHITQAENEKDQGNECIKQEKYEEAIQHYTKAIEKNNINPVYFNNRSLAYFLNYQFEQSLSDATQSVQLDSTYIKGYIRQVQALRQLNRLQEALNILQNQKDLQKVGEFKQATTELLDEIEKVERLKIIGEELDSYNTLVSWIQENSVASINKIEIRKDRIFGRGVAAMQNIKKGSEVISIPLQKLITLEYAIENSKINLEIQKIQNELAYKKHSIFAVFLLEEKLKKDNSEWIKYIKMLPTSNETDPIYYGETEMEQLKGSSFINNIQEKKQDLQQDYNLISQNSEYFKKNVSYKDFCDARSTVSSRNFGIEVNGQVTSALVPIADLLNHKFENMAEWNFSNEKQCFTVTATEDIKRGSQSPCEQLNMDFYGYMRFITLNSKEALDKLIQIHQEKQNKGEKVSEFQIKDTPPINAENEIEMWKSINEYCFTLLSSYPTNLIKDYEVRDDPNSTENQKNCAIIVSGEKEILMSMVQTSQKMLSLFQLSQKEIVKAMLTSQYKEYAVYISKVIINTLQIGKSQDKIPNKNNMKKQK